MFKAGHQKAARNRSGMRSGSATGERGSAEETEEEKGDKHLMPRWAVEMQELPLNEVIPREEIANIQKIESPHIQGAFSSSWRPPKNNLRFT